MLIRIPAKKEQAPVIPLSKRYAVYAREPWPNYNFRVCVASIEDAQFYVEFDPRLAKAKDYVIIGDHDRGLLKVFDRVELENLYRGVDKGNSNPLDSISPDGLKDKLLSRIANLQADAPPASWREKGLTPPTETPPRLDRGALTLSVSRSEGSGGVSTPPRGRTRGPRTGGGSDLIRTLAAEKALPAGKIRALLRAGGMRAPYNNESEMRRILK